MSVMASPPAWAEALLRRLLQPSDFDGVSGDLLEEYRASVYPSRGGRRADLWYVKQVLGFVARGAGGWAALFAAAFLLRTAIDWLLPTVDFHARSSISTFSDIAILLLAAFLASLRSGSFATGPVIGLATAIMAAPIKIVGAATLMAVWHDPATMAAIHGSGGLAEAFTLPILVIVPGLFCGAVGGLLGCAAKRLRPI